MDTDEDESVMFQTDDESIDFQSEADNMSFMSRRTGRGSARSTPRTMHAPPSHAIPAIVTPPAAAPAQDADTTSSDSDGPLPTRSANPNASPRGLTATSTGKLTTQTLAAHNTAAADAPKKTVVSAALRARAASHHRGRSPGLASPPSASNNQQPAPQAKPVQEQPKPVSPRHLEVTARPTPAACDHAPSTDETTQDSTGEATPPQAAEGGAPHQFDAAGVARMMQLLNQKAHAAGVAQLGTPPSSFRIQDVDSEPSAAASPNDLQLDLMAIQQHQRMLAEHHARIEEQDYHHQHEGAAHGSSPTAAPTRESSTRPGADRNNGSTRPSVSLDWCRDLNAELARENAALAKRVEKEQSALTAVTIVPKSTVTTVTDTYRSQQPQPRRSTSSTSHRPAPQRPHSKSTTPLPAKPTERGPKAHHVAAPKSAARDLDESSEAVVRRTASRYGVILPDKRLVGDDTMVVALPDRLFFATGVQLTRDQRLELLDRMRAAMKTAGTHGATPSETELGSRASSLLRTVHHTKEQAATSLSPKRSPSLNAAARQGPASPPGSGGGMRGAPEWAPFTGAMRQRTRESSSQRGRLQIPMIPEHTLALMPKSRKRTEVLRDVFSSLSTHGRSKLYRSELQTMYSELVAAGSEHERAAVFADMGLTLHSALVRRERSTVMHFIVDVVIPLLLFSGFEEFDFPIFSQTLLRVADGESHPSDFAFQPTAQSPLGRRRAEGRLPQLDISRVGDRINEYLSDLCASTAVGAIYTVHGTR